MSSGRRFSSWDQLHRFPLRRCPPGDLPIIFPDTFPIQPITVDHVELLNALRQNWPIYQPLVEPAQPPSSMGAPWSRPRDLQEQHMLHLATCAAGMLNLINSRDFGGVVFIDRSTRPIRSLLAELGRQLGVEKRFPPFESLNVGKDTPVPLPESDVANQIRERLCTLDPIRELLIADEVVQWGVNILRAEEIVNAAFPNIKTVLVAVLGSNKATPGWSMSGGIFGERVGLIEPLPPAVQEPPTIQTYFASAFPAPVDYIEVDASTRHALDRSKADSHALQVSIHAVASVIASAQGLISEVDQITYLVEVTKSETS